VCQELREIECNIYNLEISEEDRVEWREKHANGQKILGEIEGETGVI